MIEFSGRQGQNNWSYGYWNRTADADKQYMAWEAQLCPRNGTNTVSATDHWNGGDWDISAAVFAPWTEMTGGCGHSNGIKDGADHWLVRRCVREFTGAARFAVTLADGRKRCSGPLLWRTRHGRHLRISRRWPKVH